jgi:hypothetical protein
MRAKGPARKPAEELTEGSVVVRKGSMREGSVRKGSVRKGSIHILHPLEEPACHKKHACQKEAILQSIPRACSCVKI